MKRFLLFVAAAFLLLIGIIGIVTPLIPGWPFFILGLSFVAPRLAARLRIQVEGHFFKKNILIYEEWKKQNVRAGITTRYFPFIVGKTEEFKDPEVCLKLRTFLSKDPLFLKSGLFGLKRFVFLNQTHEDHIEVLEEGKISDSQEFFYLEATDAVMTNVQGLNLVVLTADCLPVYFEAGDWVALVHAGWRGTQKRIVAKTYELIREKSGRKEVKVIFGPCIRKESYEVGPEFKDYFERTVSEINGRFCFDLPGENERQLLEAGALKEDILDVEICTVRDNKTFYSFRKEKDRAGRMISFISKIP